MGLRTFLWQRIGAYPVRIRGEKFTCHPRHRRRWRNTTNSRWEPRTLDILDERLSPESVMWDIGAHIGQVSLYASRKCRRVVCFEPDAATLPYLHWNVTRNRADNVVVVGAALAAETGFRRMGSHRENGQAGEVTNSFFPSSTASTAVAPCLGREVWAEWLRAEPPDFVKMDIEGGEFELLPAMREWLSQNRPKLLLSLHAPDLLDAGRMTAAEAESALNECASVLSVYGEFTELSSEKKFPMSEFTARLSEKHLPDWIWQDGIYLE